jgi:uncharacterized protein YdhG (YjbR/CyaY superfamily)
VSENSEVDIWMSQYDNPQKELMQAVRAAILESDVRIRECIKWQAPTFVYKGNLASFFPKAKAHVSLMFHTGATIPGIFKILEGTSAEGRSVKILDATDLRLKKSELKKIVKSWCDMKDGK